MQIKLTTGERLTDLRREHNLTLEQVSEQTGIVKSTLSCWRREIATIFCREYLTNFCRRPPELVE